LIEIGPMPAGGATAGRTPAPRLTERHVLALGTAVSAAFVLAAAVVAFRSAVGGGSMLAALHLALVGGATVAIGTYMPHFAVTLSASGPASPIGRLAVLALLELGALGVVTGLTILGPAATGVGAGLALAGVAGTAVLTLLPARNPLARRHPIATASYLLALGELALAMAIGAAGAIGVPTVLVAWASLRPAHAWLALFGAVSLTIFGTLVYLAPTILGARIRPNVPLVVGLVGMAAGPILAAVGFAADVRPAVAAGIGTTLAGGIGQAAYALDTYRRRGRFTSEHDWRRLSVGHLLAGTGWFVPAVGVALVGILRDGSVAGWSLGLLALPMVAGWMLQELVGSWTYLVPSVTPGGPERHAAQRRMLAAVSRTRLVAWNTGVGAAWIGLAIGERGLATAGLALLGGAVALSLLTLARALLAR
jgi:hypothetical protein